jgi:hypothetical protein
MFHPAPITPTHPASLLPLTALAVVMLIVVVAGAVYSARR